jgi:hypothetical protein
MGITVDVDKLGHTLSAHVKAGRAFTPEQVFKELQQFGDPNEVASEALQASTRHAALRPFRLFLLQVMRELAARGESRPPMMSKLWEYSIQLVDVFGDDEIQKTIAALSYTQTGCKFLASHAFQKLVALFQENDPRSDWASWIAYVAGILAGRNVKLPPGVSKDLESAIGRLPSERAGQARSLVAFHRS